MDDKEDTEDGNVIISPVTMDVRPNFSVTHLMSAARFSRHTGEVENANKGQPFGPFFEELLTYASGSILLSVAALESYANELFVDTPSNFPDVKPDVLEKKWAEIEKKSSILEKFSTALTLLDAKAFDKGAQPYQDTRKLICLRNELTHFKPEWLHKQLKHDKLSRQLQGRFEGSPFLLDKDEGLFPHRFASHSCTKWAVETCLAFAAEFESKSGLESRFSAFQKKLAP